jgi:hypothetical protein
MRKFILTTMSAITLTAGAALYADPAVAQPFFVRDAESILSGTIGHLVGGRNYCWYSAGWQGPGWYWCGYASRRGLGWGGGEGWHGWSSNGGGGYARHTSIGRSPGIGRGGQRGHVAMGGGSHVTSGRSVGIGGGGHMGGGHAAGGHAGGSGHAGGGGGGKGGGGGGKGR